MFPFSVSCPAGPPYFSYLVVKEWSYFPTHTKKVGAIIATVFHAGGLFVLGGAGRISGLEGPEPELICLDDIRHYNQMSVSILYLAPYKV